MSPLSNGKVITPNDPWPSVKNLLVILSFLEFEEEIIIAEINNPILPFNLP